jgi:hypothetical protein
LHLVDVTASRAAERPVLNARAGLGDALDLHCRLTHQAAPKRSSAERQCGFWKLANDAPLLIGGSATLSVTESQCQGGDVKTVRFVGRHRKSIRIGVAGTVIPYTSIMRCNSLERQHEVLARLVDRHLG